MDRRTKMAPEGRYFNKKEVTNHIMSEYDMTE